MFDVIVALLILIHYSFAVERLGQAERFAQLSEAIYLEIERLHGILLSSFVRNYRDLLSIKRDKVDIEPHGNERALLLELRRRWQGMYLLFRFDVATYLTCI